MPETVRELTAATNTLAAEVHALTDRLRKSEKENAKQAEILKDQRRWIKVQAVSIAAILAGGFWLWNVAADANNAADAVQTSSVKNCQNANQSRKGTLRLWLGIIDAPRPAGSPARTEEQLQQVADLRQFVRELYQERDCEDLNRTYPLPELPDSLKPRSE